MNKVINVGVDIKNHGLFEGQYKVPNGMAYNSYLLIGGQVCLFDTVDTIATNKWLENIDKTLNGKSIDYLIISHAEPDHSYNIATIANKYPDLKIVATMACFKIISQFYNIPQTIKQIIVKDGDSLNLGDISLQFYTAPMVHWPEVMVTYESSTRTLFSADSFGRFGVSTKCDNWVDDAREYYVNIVGKYGMQTQALLKKLANLNINSICPLHGNVLSENLEYYINLYNTWSSYNPEEMGVFIGYTTVYGNTEKVAKTLYDNLKSKGINCTISNLVTSEMSENIEQAFKYSHIILATTTYENDIFPAMNDFINHLLHKNLQNKKIGIIENGSWAPAASKLIKAKLVDIKNITILEPVVTILSSPNENTWQTLDKLVQAVTNELK